MFALHEALSSVNLSLYAIAGVGSSLDVEASFEKVSTALNDSSLESFAIFTVLVLKESNLLVDGLSALLVSLSAAHGGNHSSFFLLLDKFVLSLFGFLPLVHHCDFSFTLFGDFNLVDGFGFYGSLSKSEFTSLFYVTNTVLGQFHSFLLRKHGLVGSITLEGIRALENVVSVLLHLPEQVAHL